MKLGLISDIHEDIVSLAKALRLLEKAGCDEIACLGDIVGFSSPFYTYHNTRNANECIKLVSENVKYVVAGNHDHYAIRKLPFHVPGFELPSNWYSLPFHQRLEISQRKLWLYEESELSALLNDSSAEFLNNLPEMLILDTGEFNIMLSHFLYPDITGITTKFLTQTQDFAPHLQLMHDNNTKLALFGHTHQAGLFVVNRSSTHAQTVKKISTNSSLYGAGIPAIASGKNYSGCAMLDTNNRTLFTFSLKSLFQLI
jgi:predicted phosphodiesterase